MRNWFCEAFLLTCIVGVLLLLSATQGSAQRTPRPGQQIAQISPSVTATQAQNSRPRQPAATTPRSQVRPTTSRNARRPAFPQGGSFFDRQHSPSPVINRSAKLVWRWQGYEILRFPELPSKPLTLDHIFKRACYHRNASYRKIKDGSCRTTLDLQIWYCSFLVHDSSKEDMELAKKVQRFHEV